MREIKQKRAITVTNDSTGTPVNSFSSYIYTNFQPDEVIVRFVCVGNTTGVADVVIINSDLIDNYSICSVLDANGSANLEIHHPINQPVERTFTFNFNTISVGSTSLINFAFQAQIAIVLEFIKYA